VDRSSDAAGEGHECATPPTPFTSKRYVLRHRPIPPSASALPHAYTVCARAVSLSNFIIRRDLASYYRQRMQAGHRAGQEFLERNKGADRAWLGGFKDVSPPLAFPALLTSPTAYSCRRSLCVLHAPGSDVRKALRQDFPPRTHGSRHDVGCTVCWACRVLSASMIRGRYAKGGPDTPVFCFKVPMCRPDACCQLHRK